jgi:hypothetical protein
MSILSDVLMEALDNGDMTAEEAAFIMKGYYSEGAVRDAVHNMTRVMDASREDKASTIEQLKSNKGFADAEKNVKSYCAKAYKTMMKYSRTIAIKDNANGKADMQNLINGINSAMTKYNAAKKAAEKSDHADITPVVNKIIANLKSAQKCFASDGTPNKESLKKLASNTRMEYGNLGAVNVDAKAPKPKEDVKESSTIDFDDSVLTEGAFTKAKEAIKNSTNSLTNKFNEIKTKKASDHGKTIGIKDSDKDGIVDKVISKVSMIRTGAGAAMNRKINALKKSKDYTASDDISDANHSLSKYASDIGDSIKDIKSSKNGSKYVGGLTKIMNYIKNAASSKNPNDIETFRMNMMGMTVAVVEAYSFEAAMAIIEDDNSIITETTTSDLWASFKAKSKRFNYLATQYQVDMSSKKISAAKADLKEMSTILTSMRNDLSTARSDSSILETIGYNILWSLALTIIICAPLGLSGIGAISLDAGIAAVTAGQNLVLAPLSWVEFAYDAIGVCDEYRRTGNFNFNALNVSMNVISARIEMLAIRLARMSNELSMVS